eukprot:CAMPEP_0119122152 /NCGR_PEP_ID=MMETSP1310-20130426/2498_1 /TAXON_ID=464262 /ORGANISM="Genus nov. species nov., Strain RCC2339" /LENGTH=401 /DNA_ID=CAMNT_0007111769 /DNA_START=66 /DNA_END=1271 /DNA_ORIENTATION=+
MAEKQAESRATGSFRGIFTLKTQEDADALSHHVHKFLDISVTVFYELNSEENCKENLKRTVHGIVGLLEFLPEICHDEESKAQAKGVVEKLRGFGAGVCEVLDEHQAGAQLTKDQDGRLRDSLRGMLMELCTIADLMEQQQRQQCFRLVKRSFVHLQILRESEAAYRADEKVKRMMADFELMNMVLERRADVLRGDMDDLSAKLEAFVAGTRQDVQNLGRTYLGVVRASAESPQQAAARRELEAAVRTAAVRFSEFLKVMQDDDALYRSKVAFDYVSMAEALEALRRALAAGDQQAAIAQARGIGQQVKQLDQDDIDLSDSVRKLREMTARLLGAAKESMHNPEQSSPAALDRAMADVKASATVVARKSHATRKDNTSQLKTSLLQCAQDLSTDMSGMLQE